MRFTSNRHSCVALLLSILLSIQWTFPLVSEANTLPGVEPALFLKYASPDIPEVSSREILDPIPKMITEGVRVQWVAVPVETPPVMDLDAKYPVPDDTALKRISEKISRASRHMEKVENEEAAKLLSEAEKEARGYRFGEATRPFFAEIFLEQGILKLREGDVLSGELLFSKSRALRPGFVPDPALFPPQVIAAWKSVTRRSPLEVELLVQSVPSGAIVSADGVAMGRTPVRVRPGKIGLVKIRVSHPGYLDAEVAGQWLPGDAATLDFNLSGDRVARLGELLSESRGKQGWGTGPLIGEFAAVAGVQRVAIVTLEKESSGEGYVVRAYSGGKPGSVPAFLGEKRISADKRGSRATGKWLAEQLVENGWPEEKQDSELQPWYKSWWIWGIITVATIGAAAAIAGGGGGGGSNGSSVVVDF